MGKQAHPLTRGVSFFFSAEQQWEQLWASDDYENDYYYIGQLFEPNWQPRSMV